MDRQKKSGNFQLMINFMGAGCDYANGMGATLTSKQFPTKTEIKGNVGRYSDPVVDAAVDGLTGTTDAAKTKELVGVLVNTMMTQFPVIPVVLRPGPSHLPHRQGGGLAERGGSLLQPAGQQRGSG